MRVAGIIKDSITNGVGIRDVIFLQGCPHHCKGCHNPQTWDYNGGTEMSITDILEELQDSSNNITISGGEPLEQLQELLYLLVNIKKTGKSIWLYTGYTFGDSTPHDGDLFTLLANYVDVIVDGKYVKELTDTNLQFRGSSNQRLIDLKQTVIQQKIIEWEDKYEEVME